MALARAMKNIWSTVAVSLSQSLPSVRYCYLLSSVIVLPRRRRRLSRRDLNSNKIFNIGIILIIYFLYIYMYVAYDMYRWNVNVFVYLCFSRKIARRRLLGKNFSFFNFHISFSSILYHLERIVKSFFFLLLLIYHILDKYIVLQCVYSSCVKKSSEDALYAA